MSDKQSHADVTDEDRGDLVRSLWVSTNPSREALQIRSGFVSDLDDSRWGYIPDYVWDLIDIAAQRGIEKGRSQR